MAYSVLSVKDETMDQWIKNENNVLLAGLQGVGKTAMIKAAFERNGLNWRYFSAATMDPWTDFVGVPKERTNEKGESYLDFVLPKDFADDSVEALFFDEFNRAPKKVRNAVMELMQFKSINGRHFKNLKVVWAAVNPKDSEDMSFDVDEIDPAQEDRFHIQVEIPYKPSYAYFVGKYGEDQAKAATDWWDSLDASTKLMVSPRRLDYALECFEAQSEIRYVLPREANAAALYSKLHRGSPEKTLKNLMKENNVVKARQFLGFQQNITALENSIKEDEAIRKFALPLLSAENIATLLTSHKEIKNEVYSNPHAYREIITNIANGSQNRKLKKECIDLLPVLNRDVKEGDGPIDMIPVHDLPEASPKWERKHFSSNFKIKDDYDIVDSDAFDGDTDAKLKDLVSKSIMARNSYYRGQIITGLTEVVSKELNSEQSKICLKLIEYILSKSNSKSIQDKTNLPILFNTCFHCIVNEEPKFDAKDIADNNPYIYYKLFSDKSANLANSYVNKFCIEPKDKGDQVDYRQKDPELSEIEI